MDVTQLTLTGWSNGEKLALTCVQIWSRPKWAQIIASQLKCTKALAKRSRKQTQVLRPLVSTFGQGLKIESLQQIFLNLVYLANLEWYVVLWRKIRKIVDFAWHRRKYAFVIRKRTLNADFHIIARCHGTGCPGWYDREDILFPGDRCSYRYTMAENGIWCQRSLRF